MTTATHDLGGTALWRVVPFFCMACRLKFSA
jgi:hypothetical protein